MRLQRPTCDLNSLDGRRLAACNRMLFVWDWREFDGEPRAGLNGAHRNPRTCVCGDRGREGFTEALVA